MKSTVALRSDQPCPLSRPRARSVEIALSAPPDPIAAGPHALSPSHGTRAFAAETRLPAGLVPISGAGFERRCTGALSAHSAPLLSGMLRDVNRAGNRR